MRLLYRWADSLPLHHLGSSLPPQKNMNRRSELILKDSWTHNILSPEVVEADMTMKIAVNRDVCDDGGGGMNFWAEEQGGRNQRRHHGRTDKCWWMRRNSPEAGLRWNSIWAEERVHAMSMETKEPLLMKQYDVWESDQAF